MKVLVDTSVFMSIFARDRHFDKSLELFKRILERHEGFFCSMSINELIWVLKRSEYDARFIEEKVEFIFSAPLKFLSANQEIFKKSIELMKKHELTCGDSQIIAQAIVNGLDKIAGFDKDFDRVKEIERIEIISPSDR